MSYLYLNTEAAAIINDLGKTDNKKDSLVAKLSPLLAYTAFRASECETKDLYVEVKAAIKASFDKQTITFMDYSTAEAKSLNEAQKAIRKAGQEKIGSRAADLYHALKKLQVAGYTDGRKAKTLREFIEAEIGKIENRIAKASNPDIKSVKATADALAALRATL